MADNSSQNVVKPFLIFFSGAIVLGIHVGIFLYSQPLFNILISLYLITYCILIIMFMNKNKATVSNSEYSLVYGFSIYTLILQIFLILFVLGTLMYKSYVIKPRTTIGYNYST